MLLQSIEQKAFIHFGEAGSPMTTESFPIEKGADNNLYIIFNHTGFDWSLISCEIHDWGDSHVAVLFEDMEHEAKLCSASTG